MRYMVLLVLVCTGVVLCSCATFTPRERHDSADLSVPSAYTLYEEGAPAPEQWWQSFNSEELNGLVADALQDNLTLAQVYARLEQARQAVVQAGAARYPAVSASGDASVTLRHTEAVVAADTTKVISEQLSALNTLLGGAGGSPSTPDTALESAIAGLSDARSRLGALDTLLADRTPDNATVTTKSYGLGLSTSYEVDLWGRIKSAHQAALLDLEASRENVYAARLSLSGAVVGEWLDIVAARQEKNLLDKQLELNRQVLDLLELRYRAGMSSALDVYQQRQIIAETEARYPPLESRIETAMNNITLLLGRYPGEEVGLQAAALPSLPALPEPGIPADLLAMRPDVRAAGLALRAADWRVAAAKANRLPALRLSASAAYGAEDWALLFDNWMATLAASVTGPIFEGGKRKAEVARTRAVVEERLAQYRLAVITAVKEVEDAMIQEEKQGAYIKALERQLDTANTLYTQALERYKKGMNTYLPVLTALTTVQVVERTLVGARLNQSLYRQRLHLALGGAWMREIPARPAE